MHTQTQTQTGIIFFFCRANPDLLDRHQAFAVSQVWLGSQVRGRLLLALSYHLLRPEGLHHWGEEEGAELLDTAQRREEGGEGRMSEEQRSKEQKRVEGAQKAERAVGGGWWQYVQAGQGRAQVPWGELQGRLLPVHLWPKPSATETERGGRGAGADTWK